MSEQSDCASYGGDRPLPVTGERVQTGRRIGRDASSRDSRGVKLVVKLIVNLERLANTDLPLQVRVELLRAFAPGARQLAARAQKCVVVDRQHAGNVPRRAVPAQRIHGLMVRNLERALAEIDRSANPVCANPSALRRWLMRQMLLFLGRQIEYSFMCVQPWDPGVWQKLHDVHLYLAMRQDDGNSLDGAGFEEELDADTEYKRLLLIGIAKMALALPWSPGCLLRALPTWARASVLRDLAACRGEFGHYVVNIAKDEPPRKSVQSIGMAFSGWVLEPATDFVEYLIGADVKGLDANNPLDRRFWRK